ncbi:helix-turn-helix domain-containing protein [Variovorax sp. OV329]|uniref:helix-turn-helix domain-containing protein n=1 Tax=Variovorax sp. OV329 TaxID=1882825 RepID=UPI0008E3C9BE|nr:helix-turn-helix domain-containing protein [Variovorax sp. OV329]SFM92059.1 AraC-type DNA-binding protein [Variovorax sp. OV329]
MLYIPRDLLDEALPHPMRLHGLSPDNACAGLLGEHLAALLQMLPSATPQETAGLAQATVSLVAASLATCPKNAQGARPAIESVLLRRARKHVEQHLREEALSAAMLCAHLRISRSTLYRLFGPLGGVSQYIKERRLARIHELLSGASERPQIARLAEDHGFKSAAHFSKAFREQFGYSAREVPRHGTAPVVAGAHSLDRWLGALCH